MSTVLAVGDLVIQDLGVKINDKSLKHLIPSVLVPQKVSIELTGVNTAIANGLRRSVMSELPVKCLYFDYSDFTKDNPYTLIDLIQNRIRSIPIKQSVDASARFELRAENQTSMFRYVYASEIKQTAGQKAKVFNDQFPLFSLEPGKFVNISNIYILTSYGHDFAGHSVAFSGVITPTDVQPIDVYTGKGLSSSVSNPHDYMLTFTTNGTMDAKDILIAACESIITRVKNILNLLQTIVPSNDMYTLHIDGETDTIGRLLTKHINDLYPDIDAVVLSVDSIMRSFNLRIKTKDDVNAILQSAIGDIIEKFSRLKILFASK